MTFFGSRRRTDDPGPSWTEAALRPLRTERVDPDVARAVMRRIAAGRARPLPDSFRLRRPRLALASCVAGGLVAFGLVSATLVTLVAGGDDGVRQIGALASSAGRIVVALGGFALALLQGILSAGLLLLRGAWTLLEAAAPLLRGAGLIGAAAGILSILISSWLLAQACRTAPLIADANGGAAPRGGFR